MRTYSFVPSSVPQSPPSAPRALPRTKADFVLLILFSFLRISIRLHRYVDWGECGGYAYLRGKQPSIQGGPAVGNMSSFHEEAGRYLACGAGHLSAGIGLCSTYL